MDEQLASLDKWLHETWDPKMTLREWWVELARTGWAAPTWPVEWHGRGLSLADWVAAERVMVAAGAVPGPGSFGIGLVGPTLCALGNDDQRRRHMWPIASGALAWCQLFSEPGAGSDLAGLQTRAERDGDTWVVNGQKVWTSGGQMANWAILLARTNFDVPKHAGITYFLINMDQPGIEVRPLREMTGRAFFNEVFLTDARVASNDLVGGEGNGWTVANTTLAFERALSSIGSFHRKAQPGTLAGDLDLPAGDFAVAHLPGEEASAGLPADLLIEAARRHGRLDPLTRQGLARLWSLERIIELSAQRARSESAAGRTLPGVPNLAKMGLSRALRLRRDLTFSILGPESFIYDYDYAGGGDEAPADSSNFDLLQAALFAQGPQIYGGSEQIQRNIVGERVLGLPREPGHDRSVPFRDLPKNG